MVHFRTIFATYLAFACMNISFLNAENERSAETTKATQESSEPALIKSANLDVDRKSDRYPNYYNQENLGNNFQDNSQFYPRNEENNMYRNWQKYPYPATNNYNTYDKNDNLPYYLNRPIQYYPSLNRPDDGFSNANIYGQYPDQGFVWDQQSKQPTQNGFFNQGVSNQNALAGENLNQERYMYATGLPHQTGISNVGQPNQNAILKLERPNQNEFSNLGISNQNGFSYNGQPDNQVLENTGRPNLNGFDKQGRPDYSETTQERQTQNEFFNKGRPQTSDQKPIGEIKNQYPRQFPYQVNENLGQNNINRLGQLYGPRLNEGQGTSNEQLIHYRSQDLLITSTTLPDDSIGQNENHTRDDNAAAIKAVLVPETTLSSDQIIFPDTYVKASTSQKQCAQDCLATSEDDPVCGTDKVTYVNPEKLICTRNCGKSVYLLHNGVCAGDST